MNKPKSEILNQVQDDSGGWDTKKILYDGVGETPRGLIARAALDGEGLQYAELRGADLQGVDLEEATLTAADFRHADLRYANLRGANLNCADLRYADFRYADLRDADFFGAVYRHADFRYAQLRGAKYFNKLVTTPLYTLLDQPEPVRAYKLVNEEWEGPMAGGVKYEIGKKIVASDFDDDEYDMDSHTGLHLASLDWVLAHFQAGWRVLVCEFSKTAGDGRPNVCIPVASDGRFRVRELTVAGEKDLGELGLE